jgi:endonuclease/exonuclease/phosphatase family metal-dependent hydrolase
MLNWMKYFVCLWTIQGLSSHLPAEEPLRLRVLTYNIHHGEGVDGKLDLVRISKVIQEVEPDIVALQEVDQNAGRSGKVDQAAELGRLTKMRSVFGGNIGLQGGEYGNALLTRFEIIKQQNDRLPNLANGEQRGDLQVLLRVPGRERPLTVLATHFDHRRSDEERFLSAQRINSKLDLAEPAILLGDLNDVIGSRTLDLLDSCWKRVNDEPMATIPVKNPIQQIDFILVRPSEGWKSVETKVLDEEIASDHRPFLAVVELN